MQTCCARRQKRQLQLNVWFVKVCKGDLEHLKAGLEEARSTCYLTGVLADTDCHYHLGK